jgi:hypothetical protein
MQRTTILAVLLLTAGLAGCMGDDASDDAVDPSSTDLDEPANETNETDVTEPEGPQINTTWFNATVQGNNIPGLGEYCYPCDTHEWTHEVPNGTGALLVEAFWETSASMRLGVNAPGDDCEFNTANDDCAPEDAAGQSSLTVRPTQVPGGEWNLEIWPRDTPDQSVDVTVVVSEFTGDSVPTGYTKAPAP